MSPRAQLVALSALLAAAGLLAYLGVGRLAFDRAVAAKEAAVIRAESANADLQNDLAQLQDRVAATSRSSAEAVGRLAGFADQATRLRGLLGDAQAKLDELEKKRDRLLQENTEMQNLAAAKDATPPEDTRIAGLSRALGEAQQDLHQTEAQRATLTARLSKTEADRAAEHARFAQYQASLEQTAKELQQIKAERDKAAGERDRLKARIDELEKKLSRRDAHGGKSMTALRSVERVLASTGINVARLLPKVHRHRAEGGPFVPPPKGSRATVGITSDQLAALRSLAKSLPLAVPVDHYQIGSDFGSRRDPFNGRRSFHTGLDLDARYNTPVYATAPGTVVYAGYRGDYGKVVEIDHGNGVETRYAHLHRFVVSSGQRVETHARIGYLGSTGRSSGPHVHYEVLVNGEAQDPEKFIALARLIPTSDR